MMKFETTDDPNTHEWIELPAPMPVQELLDSNPERTVTITDASGLTHHWRVAKPRNLELYDKVRRAIYNVDLDTTAAQRVYNLLEEEGLV